MEEGKCFNFDLRFTEDGGYRAEILESPAERTAYVCFPFDEKTWICFSRSAIGVPE
jgi:hypothetical protein